MDISWADRLSLFRYALAAAALAGLVCPLVGSLLYLRRTSFYGITLPQFAAAGVVFGFVLLPWWIAHVGLGGLTLDQALADSHAGDELPLRLGRAVHLRRAPGAGRGSGSGGGDGSRSGAWPRPSRIANAATYLFGRLSPIGRSFVDELLHGRDPRRRAARVRDAGGGLRGGAGAAAACSTATCS